MSLDFTFVPGTDIWLDPPALDQGIVREPNKVPILSGPNHDFTKSSLIHGRCHNDPNGYLFADTNVLDGYGNEYFALSAKGIDLSGPEVQLVQSGNFKIRVMGALEADTFYRCRKASEILRAAGILTEYVFYQGRPTKFPNGKNSNGWTNLNGFRQRLFRDYKNEVAEFIEQGFREEDGTEFDLATVKEELALNKFGVSFRGMISNIRLGELSQLQKDDLLGDHLCAALVGLQARKPDHFECWPEIEALNPSNKRDQTLYLLHVLPKLVGEQLALLHNIDGFHKFLHKNNWTLAGEIVDLDSIRHAEIEIEDMEEIIPGAKWFDFKTTYTELRDVYTRLYGAGINPNVITKPFYESYFRSRQTSENFSIFEQLVCEHYLTDAQTDVLAVPFILDLDPLTIDFLCEGIRDLLANVSKDQDVDEIFNPTVTIGLKKMIKMYYEMPFIAQATASAGGNLYGQSTFSLFNIEQNRLANQIIRWVLIEKGFKSKRYKT